MFVQIKLDEYYNYGSFTVRQFYKILQIAKHFMSEA